MATSVIQPFVDQENASSVNTTTKKSSSSIASRPIIGKTFSSSSTPLFTPRQALSDISNDPVRRAFGDVTNTVKKPGLSSTVKKGLASKKITLKKPTQTTGTQSTRKHKSKPVDVKQPKSQDCYPPIETMHIYEDKLPDVDVLPAEDRLSNLDLLTCSMPLLQTGVSDVDDIVPDFSLMSLYPQERTDPESMDVQLPTGSQLSECLLDLPPIDEVEFLDLNSLLKGLGNLKDFRCSLECVYE